MCGRVDGKNWIALLFNERFPNSQGTTKSLITGSLYLKLRVNNKTKIGGKN